MGGMVGGRVGFTTAGKHTTVTRVSGACKHRMQSLFWSGSDVMGDVLQSIMRTSGYLVQNQGLFKDHNRVQVQIPGPSPGQGQGPMQGLGPGPGSEPGPGPGPVLGPMQGLGPGSGDSQVRSLASTPGPSRYGVCRKTVAVYRASGDRSWKQYWGTPAGMVTSRCPLLDAAGRRRTSSHSVRQQNKQRRPAISKSTEYQEAHTDSERHAPSRGMFGLMGKFWDIRLDLELCQWLITPSSTNRPPRVW